MATDYERNEYENPFRSPVFAYTFANNRCLISGYNGACYRVPDQLYPSDITMTEAEAVTGLYTSSYQYTETYSEDYSCSTHIGTPNYNMGASYHYELYQSQEYLATSYVQQGLGRYREYLYGLSLPPAYALLLDPTFAAALAALPSTVQSEGDQNMYDMFVDGYGGYYLVSVTMGGRYDYNQYVDENWSYYHSEEETETEMNAGFNGQIFSMNYGYSSNSSEYITSEEYQENSNVEIYCRGGNVSAECGSQEWQQSIVEYPVYLTVNYAPMNMLVYDDDEKEATLKWQINYYTINGVMPTYQEAIEALITLHQLGDLADQEFLELFEASKKFERKSRRSQNLGL